MRSTTLGGRLDALAARLGVPADVPPSVAVGVDHRLPRASSRGRSPRGRTTRLVGGMPAGPTRCGTRIEVIALGHGRNDRTRLPAADDDVAEALADRIARRLRELAAAVVAAHRAAARADRPSPPPSPSSIPQASLVPGGSVPGVDFDHGRGRWTAHLSRNLRRQLQKCRNRIADRRDRTPRWSSRVPGRAVAAARRDRGGAPQP